jgi:trimeric autotransporter adhesin
MAFFNNLAVRFVVARQFAANAGITDARRQTFYGLMGGMLGQRPVGLAVTAVLANREAQQTPSIPVLGLSSLTLSPASLIGGGSSTGTLTLHGPAPTGGAVVALASSDAAATVPSSATIAAGTTTDTFTVSTNQVSSSTTVKISATFNSSTVAEDLTVNPRVA